MANFQKAENETKKNSRAVIFLANDQVAVWLLASLRSLRMQSPNIPCFIIPFTDDHIELTKSIAKCFGAELIYPSELQSVESLASFLDPPQKHNGAFRKFCSLFLGIKTVLFADADIVFFKPVEELFETFEKSKFDLLFSDSDLNQVYSNTTAINKMRALHKSRGINTGFWISKGLSSNSQCNFKR